MPNRLVARAKWVARILLTYTGLFTNCDKEELQNYQDIHEGEIAILIGNGPSVKYEHLNAIKKDRITFCFNRFHLAYKDLEFRPTYTISADTGMINDFGSEIVNGSTGTVFLIHKIRPNIPGPFIWLGSKYKPLP